MGKYDGMISRDYITGLYFEITLWDYSTESYHFNYITGLYYGLMLRNYITGSYYGIILRKYVTV